MAGSASHEVLVLLDAGAGPAATAEVGRQTRVLQSAGTRVLVVDAAGPTVDRLRAVPGVARVVDDPRQLGPLDDLDAGEQLFAQAWAERRAEPKTGPRRGEGLAWDAPGFEPP